LSGEEILYKSGLGRINRFVVFVGFLGIANFGAMFFKTFYEVSSGFTNIKWSISAVWPVNHIISDWKLMVFGMGIVVLVCIGWIVAWSRERVNKLLKLFFDVMGHTPKIRDILLKESGCLEMWIIVIGYGSELNLMLFYSIKQLT